MIDMIKIKYERYWNDYRKKNEEKKFLDLIDLEKWIFGQMQQDYINNRCVMSFPTPEAAKRINSTGPWGIEFQPVYGGEIINIHMISSSDGIIFSDGRFTAGQRHWSKEVQDWLIHCDQRRHAPEFNFVE